jgi:hypothetical protein
MNAGQATLSDGGALLAVRGVIPLIVSKVLARRLPSRRIVNFRMKLVEYVLLFRSDLPGVSGEIVEEKSLARRGKTNIVHAPPRLAE